MSRRIRERLDNVRWESRTRLESYSVNRRVFLRYASALNGKVLEPDINQVRGVVYKKHEFFLRSVPDNL